MPVKRLLLAAIAFLRMMENSLYSQSPDDILSNARMAEQNSIRLLMPSAFYAVPGVELNIYFDNITLPSDIKSLNFDVDCKYGRQDRERWRFTPEDKDVGSFPLSVKVFGMDSKLLGEATTTIFVSPKDAGRDRNISILLVGDSLTDISIYPKELLKLFKNPGNPSVKFIGSHAGSGNPPKEDAPLFEGYGGWTWSAFCTKYVEKPADAAVKGAYRHGSSPFVFLKNGVPALDFKEYCDRKNEGKAPDYITVFLGANDIFAADDTNIATTIDTAVKHADILLSEFRKTGPNTKIGLVIPVPPTATQDAFGENYNCGQTRWQYRKNQHRLAERMLRKFSGKEKENIFLIPCYASIDCVNNYPKSEQQINARNQRKILRDSNGLHPAPEGYGQIADSVYGWFKHEFADSK